MASDQGWLEGKTNPHLLKGKLSIAQGMEPTAITEYGEEFEYIDPLQHPPGSATILSQQGVVC